MSVRREGKLIILSGDCPIEDAEHLLRELLATPGASVEWSACRQLHCAILQVLLSARVPVSGLPEAPFLRAHIAPLLRAGGGT